MNKRATIIISVFVAFVLGATISYLLAPTTDDIPYTVLDDSSIESHITKSYLDNGNLIIDIYNPNCEIVKVKPATIEHHVTAGMDSVKIFNYTDQYFEVIVGNASDVYTFGSLTKTWDVKNKAVTIKSNGMPSMTVRLISSEPDLCTFTEIFEVTNFKAFTPHKDKDFKARTVKHKGKKDVTKVEWFIEQNISYVVNVTDYNVVQVDSEIYNNRTGRNETIQINKTVIAGYHDDTRYKNVWQKYNHHGKPVSKDTVQRIKVVYHKKPELGDARIQTIPLFRGVECDELTWWNTSWEYNVSNVVQDGARPYQFRLYISNTTNTNNATHVFGNGHFNSDYGDIRCILNDTTVLKYGIVDDSVDPAILWINVTTNGTVNLYYGNSTASTTGDLSDAIGGGVVTGVDDYLVHTFAASGAFAPHGSYNVMTLVSAGGGGGGGASNAVTSSGASGGGAGGYQYNPSFPVSPQSYSVTIGAGGTGGLVAQPTNNYGDGGDGGNSIFSTITSVGGGGGGDAQTSTGGNGGSGGGGTAAGTGTSGQGNNGGTGSSGGNTGGGGGGGADSVGSNNAGSTGGSGGSGTSSSITGAPITYSQGGGGGGGDGGTGGVGSGNGGDDGQNGLDGIVNRGGGGGGAGHTQRTGGGGGSGVVIIRYNNSGTWDVWSSEQIQFSISSYAPSTPLNKLESESQYFNVTTDSNCQCRWYINGTLKQTNTTQQTDHNYTNTSLEIGYFNFSAVVNTSSGATDMRTWWVTVESIATYIPPLPVLSNTTGGDFWANFTWTPGIGNTTDSYNVSYNDVWDNGTTTTYRNESVSGGGWHNITVCAWNSSGVGTLCETCVSDNIEAPSYKPPEPINLANTTGNFWVNHTWQAGGGNVTDYWNVSVNGAWYNRSYAWYNGTYSAHDWQNISVWAWNNTAEGTMSD